MRKDILDGMLLRAVSFDGETHRIQQGLLAPPLVCASIGWWDAAQGRVVGQLLDKDQASEIFEQLLDSDRVICGANISFDLLVMCVEAAKRGRDLIPKIYKALDEGRIFDIQIAEQLDAIAEGCLGVDPRTGGPLVNPDTGRRGRYSLAICVDLVLGRKNAKANDEWRERYHELDGVPLDLWPYAARVYPVDDAVNTLEVALAQAGHLPRAGVHKWGRATECAWCGVHPKAAYVDGHYLPCRGTHRSRNLHALADQVGTAWAMHLGAAWGFIVDQDAVTKILDEVSKKRAEAAIPLLECGMLKANRDGSYSKDKATIAKAVAIAYGASGSCVHCAGSGKVPSAKNPKARINCKACGATGLDLSTAPTLPKTDASTMFPEGQVSANRDTLNEAGDETLRALADYDEDAKTEQTYGPYLRKARIVDPADPLGAWADVPLTLWPNVLLETDRTSYSDPIQQFPRGGGLRACIVARGPRYEIVDVDDDYQLQEGEEWL